jgi:cell division protein FtsB
MHRSGHQTFLRLGLLTLLLALLPAHCRAQTPPQLTAEHLTFFETQIRPVLVESCYECHSAQSRPLQGGLRLDYRDGLLKGGDTGPAVSLEQPADSLLLKALRHDELQMPPKGKLPDSVVADFTTWIRLGLPDPRTSDQPVTTRHIDIVAGRQHWAFQPVTDPPLPPVADTAWPLDPIDHFVLAKLQSAGLQPQPDAERWQWLRRVSLDLTGLPPSPAQIADFTSDSSPAACEKVVDRLLQSREFAERWARHWLDLTGYADQVGTSNEVFAEHAWRYRDYVINSFHQDLPWDQFVIQQIAGDLLPTQSPQQQADYLTATGFLLVGDVEIVNPDKLKLETDHIDFQLSRIGTAFLGMTLGCARCHDHKFDPIALDDYYGMAGTLRNTVSTRKIPHGIWSGLNVRELPETPAQQSLRQQDTVAAQARIDSLKAEQQQLSQELQTLSQQLQQTDADKPKLEKRQEKIRKRQSQLPGEIRHAEFFLPAVPRAFALEDAPEPKDMPIAIRGNPYAVGRTVPRGILRVAAWEAGPVMPPDQSGRLQLATWLADRKNPLLPRVTVNRIWARLFGAGIVRTVDYFGTRGETPSHPELLDHLATRFISGGWSQKAIIRSIVLSRTYRLSSTPSNIAATTDPDNRLLSRMTPQRLDAEALRDTMLAVSGQLQPCSGGPGLPLEFRENTGSLDPKAVNPPSFALKRWRPEQEFQRTIYLPVVRSTQKGPAALRDLFDFVQPNGIAGQRTQTVVATQALYLLNNELPRKRAETLAAGLQQLPDNTRRLQQLWLTVLNRPVSDAELADAAQFLESTADPAEAWTELCHSLLGSNEFLYRL